MFFFTFKHVRFCKTSTNCSFNLFVIYRAHSSYKSKFFTELESLLEFHISSNIDLICFGDFNTHIDNLS